MAQNGYITSRIYTSQGTLPIEGAVITIISSGEGKPEILAKRTTDKNGLIVPVIISAPDEALSLEPGDEKVFTTVDARIDKEGFFTVLLKNVQVFANQTTVLDTPLIPLPDNQLYSDKADEFTETPQNL